MCDRKLVMDERQTTPPPHWSRLSLDISAYIEFQFTPTSLLLGLLPWLRNNTVKKEHTHAQQRQNQPP